MTLRSRPLEALPSAVKMALLSLLSAALVAAGPATFLQPGQDVAALSGPGTPDGEQHEQCEDGRFQCVPFYYCDEQNIVTDGVGIINIRFGGELTENAKNSPTRTHGDCPQFLDVCCTRPRLTRKEELVKRSFQPTCGRRNHDGLDVKIEGFQHHETQFGEFPWQVAILRRDRRDQYHFIGGGSLIHPQVILTAAHTVRGYSDLEVRLGEWDTQRQTEYYNHLNIGVKRVIKHPAYNAGNLHNDIALLILAAPVDLQPHMDTICLPDPSFTPRSDCVVTGWGQRAFGSNEYQTVLKAVSLPPVDSSACQRALRRTRLGGYFRLDESFMCAGGRRGEDACTGDGGSALVCPDPADPARYVQVGIVSWGVGCGNEGLPGVYADVRRFVGWIQQEVQAAGIA